VDQIKIIALCTHQFLIAPLLKQEKSKTPFTIAPHVVTSPGHGFHHHFEIWLCGAQRNRWGAWSKSLQ